MLRELNKAYANWQEHKKKGEPIGDLYMHVLEKAGHWMQADNPQGLLEMMLPWFKHSVVSKQPQRAAAHS